MRYSDVFVKKDAPYTPPAYLLQQLYSMDDGRLRLRWSVEKQKWCLERKELCGIEYVQTLPQYKKRNGIVVENDSWVRAKDGYILCGYFDPLPHLGQWVIRNLQYFNIRRIGGAQAAEMELQRLEEKERTEQERAASISREDFAKSFYDDEVWRQGERAVVPKQYEDIR